MAGGCFTALYFDLNCEELVISYFFIDNLPSDGVLSHFFPEADVSFKAKDQILLELFVPMSLYSLFSVFIHGFDTFNELHRI